MEKDCCQHVKKCHTCQSYANIIKALASELHNLTTLWPFSMWGIDVVGPMPQKAANGHLYIIVAIDYFTNWVKAISLAAVTMKNTVRFIRRDIICRYGVPRKIITDNATNFVGNDLELLCKKFKIHHHRSSPYRPQMNGVVEAANKNLKKILQKMTVNHSN